jgi:ribonuclease BN (tRNA processing enzyme)
MKIQLLHSTIKNGRGSREQHLTCYLVDDFLAIDAGSLAISINDFQRENVRNIIITHPHLDHIATLPIFIDDLFETLREPVRIHATAEAIEVLEKNIFNWDVYPRFSELKNDFGNLIEYVPLKLREEFSIGHLKLKIIPVNHVIPTVGLIISDEKTTIALSSDTCETVEFWDFLNLENKLDALFVEASFPNELSELAKTSFHLTPNELDKELKKLKRKETQIFAVHLKPSYFDQICNELKALNLSNLSVMKAGKVYEF